MTAYLVYVRSMSGTVGPQVWYDPPPRGYTGIDVVGERLPVSPHILKMSDYRLDQIEARVLRERAGA